MSLTFYPTNQSDDLPIARLLREGAWVRCDPETPVVEAARRMHEARCGSVLVMANDTPVGIWTERDALGIDLADPAVHQEPIRRFMSTPVHTIAADRTWSEAVEQTQAAGIRHLVLVEPETERPLGILSQTDLVRNQGIGAYLRLREIGTALQTAPLAVSDDTALSRAAEIMTGNGATAVLVHYADGERGVLTERDVVAALATGRGGATVGEMASRPLIVAEAGTSLLAIQDRLPRQGIRRIGVTDEAGTLLGLVSLDDLLLPGVESLFQQAHEPASAPAPGGYLDGVESRVIAQAWEGIMVTDAENRIIRVNAAFTRITGYREEEVLGQTPAVLNSRVHEDRFYAALWDELLRTDGWCGEIWNRHKDGSHHPHQLCISVLRDREGRVTHHVGMFTDLSAVHQRERHYRSIFENATVGIAELDLTGAIRVANPVFEGIIGWSDQEINGHALFDFIHPEDRARCHPLWTELTEGRRERYTGEERYVTRQGTEQWLEVTVTLVRDGDGRPESAICVAVDVDERRQREDELERRIAFDHLTGAYNRIKLEHQLETETQKADRVGYPVTLVMFDVDRFKRVNDTLGHDVGDRVLQELVRRVQSRIRQTDMLARWGGEEFMLMLPGTDYRGGLKLAETIRREIADTPFPEAGTVTVSFGVGTYRAGEPLKPLIKRVDQALYRAKDEGRNRVVGAEEAA